MIIVRVMQGMGNQMFQYAFYRKLQEEGYNVKIDNTYYKEYQDREFCIPIFPNAKMDIVPHDESVYNLDYKVKNKIKRILLRFFNRYIDEDQSDNYDLDVINRKKGIISGYFQNEEYFKGIEDEIRFEFKFPPILNAFNDIKKEILTNESSVSLHVRRGDYLRFKEIYGNICTKDYYKKAIDIVQKRIKNPFFYIFTDDINWVNENLDIENSKLISDYLPKVHESWYDMYFMSICHHNIIANSTFSWWGAWLNNNENKMVICPSKWDNIHPKRKPLAHGWIEI